MDEVTRRGGWRARADNEELYRAQDLNPVYQNPDRRGRAELRSATRDDQDGERLIIYTDAHLCIRILIAEAGRSYARLHETIKMEKGPVSKICDLSTGRLGLPQF